MGMEELFQSVEKEHVEPLGTKVTGTIPEWIEGSLYRNGPAKFEIGDTKFNHWFDGMGMIHRFKISKGQVTYQNRFIESTVYKKNMQANRIICSEFGTRAFPDPCKTWYERIFSYFKMPPSTDNTLVNIFPIGERLYTATETNFINRIDPETLATAGKVDLTQVVSVHGATAHPHIDPDGSVYNIGSIHGGPAAYTFVKITPPKPGDKENFCEKAEIVAQIPAQWKMHPSYMHSFGITPNYLVFIEQPLAINIFKILTSNILGRTFDTAMEYYPEYPVKFHVIDRKTKQKVNPETSYIADSFYTFHHANAYEENGQLVVDVCILHDASTFKSFRMEKLQAPGVEDYLNTFPMPEGARFVLPLDLEKAEPGKNLITIENTTSTATMSPIQEKDGVTRQVKITKDLLHEIAFDFPMINYAKYNGHKYRYIYAVGHTKNQLDTLVKLDVKTREMKSWLEKDVYPSEPVFVPSPDAKDEDDGVLLSVILSTGPNRTASLLVLDARTMQELGRAEAAVKIGRDTHGTFVPSTTLLS